MIHVDVTFRHHVYITVVAEDLDPFMAKVFPNGEQIQPNGVSQGKKRGR